jgi:hypothetical protein
MTTEIKLTEEERRHYAEMEAAHKRHEALKARVFNRLDPMVIRTMAALFLHASERWQWYGPEGPDDFIGEYVYEAARDYLGLVGCSEEHLAQVEAVMERCAYRGTSPSYGDDEP